MLDHPVPGTWETWLPLVASEASMFHQEQEAESRTSASGLNKWSSWLDEVLFREVKEVFWILEVDI